MTVAEVAFALRTNTETSRSLFRRPDKPFSGKVDQDRFTITRVIRNYKNSFVPQMSGVVIPDNGGARIDIRLTLLPLVKGFMVLWFGFLFIFSPIAIIAGISRLLSGNTDGIAFTLIPIIMLVFGFLLTHGAFRFEIPRSKRSLREIISATEIDSEQGAGDQLPTRR